MDKNVRVHIYTANDYEDHKDEQTKAYKGTYSFVNGKMFCIYEDEECKNTIKIDGKRVHLNRKSSQYASTMVFAKGEESTSCFTLGGVSMAMDIVTHELDIAIGEDKVDINIIYTLIMDGLKVSENTVNIRVEEWRQE